MATNEPEFSLADFHPEELAAVEFAALQDADRVGVFLNSLSLSAAPKKLPGFPARFLLLLGAALRLLNWEAKGFSFHFVAGLPKANEAIRIAFQSLNNPHADTTNLCASVLRLMGERFAWRGTLDFGAEVALDDLKDDTAVDALAEFLWATRAVGRDTQVPKL